MLNYITIPFNWKMKCLNGKNNMVHYVKLKQEVIDELQKG